MRKLFVISLVALLVSACGSTNVILNECSFATIHYNSTTEVDTRVTTEEFLETVRVFVDDKGELAVSVGDNPVDVFTEETADQELLHNLNVECIC